MGDIFAYIVAGGILAYVIWDIGFSTWDDDDDD